MDEVYVPVIFDAVVIVCWVEIIYIEMIYNKGCMIICLYLSIPDAGSGCPILDLVDPISSGPSRVSPQNTFAMVFIS